MTSTAVGAIVIAVALQNGLARKATFPQKSPVQGSPHSSFRSHDNGGALPPFLKEHTTVDGHIESRSYVIFDIPQLFWSTGRMRKAGHRKRVSGDSVGFNDCVNLAIIA